MPKVQQTISVTIDDAVYEVAKMSNEVQQLIAYMDEWRQDEADVSTELLKVRAAVRDIQNTLMTTIRQEREEALKKAEAMGIVPPVDQTATDGEVSVNPDAQQS